MANQAHFSTVDKASRESLEAKLAHYVSLYDFSPIGYLTLDAQGVIQEINLNGADIIKTERNWLLNRIFTCWVHGPSIVKFREHMKRCRNGEPLVCTELEIVRSDRVVLPAQLVSVAFQGNCPEPLFRTSLTDLSYRKETDDQRASHIAQLESARAEATRENRAKDEFLAIISHELRTPLQPILSWARLLQLGKLTQEETIKGLAMIEQSARTQAKLINDLLDVSRIISGKLKLEMRPLDFASAIESAIESCRPDAASAGVVISTNLRHGVTVLGDPARLQQIVWNLLTNAIKFNPRGGSVTVTLNQTDDEACLVVQDAGRGIAPEFLPYIFDRFRQADCTSTRSKGGLGLGLAIVRHLVEHHGGKVMGSSKGLNRGATFTVTLPLAEAICLHERAEAYGPTYCNMPRLRGIRVLVVDDEAVTRESLASALRECEAEVLSASSASEALRLIQREQPDVLISDLGMPDEDGFNLIENIRKLGRNLGRDIPAAALTAYAAAEDIDHALRAGFQLHIAKPVDPTCLAKAVEKLALQKNPD